MSVVDTNLLIYATTLSSPYHARADAALIQASIPSKLAIPRQVLREYLAVMTGRGSEGTILPMKEAMTAVEAFQRLFDILDDGPAVWAQFRRLSLSVPFGGKQVHDANLVACMLAYGETRLVTFNAKHFRRFEPLIEITEP